LIIFIGWSAIFAPCMARETWGLHFNFESKVMLRTFISSFDAIRDSIVGIRRRVYRFNFSQQLLDIFRSKSNDTNIKLGVAWVSLALLGSAWRCLGQLGVAWVHLGTLNILASVEHSYLAPRLIIWRLWLIPQFSNVVSF
jgi:hypothetical protein